MGTKEEKHVLRNLTSSLCVLDFCAIWGESLTAYDKQEERGIRIHS